MYYYCYGSPGYIAPQQQYPMQPLTPIHPEQPKIQVRPHETTEKCVKLIPVNTRITPSCGDTENYEPQPYPPDNNYLDDQLSKLQIYKIKEDIDTENHIRRKAADTDAQIHLANHRAEKEKELLEKKEELKTSRDLTVVNLINDDGKVCVIHTKPDGKKDMSAPIVDINGIRVFKIIAAGCNDFFYLFEDLYRNNEFYVKGDITPKRLMSVLRKHGIAIKLPRDNNVDVRELLHQLILQNVVEKERSRQFGWNRMIDGRWHFENNICNTMEGIKYE